MKRFIASAGLLAVGTVGLNAQYGTPVLTRGEMSKPWSVSASLRGFYDDNYYAAHKDFKDESFGFEFSPAGAIHFDVTEQTRLRFDYIYSLRYYEGRADEQFDHSHEFRARADHRFSERYSISLEDAFVYAQEPIIIDEGIPTAVGRLETDADALRNRAAINGTAQITELFGIGAGYQNYWVDWEQDGIFSRSALLDRMEHLFRLDGRWQIQPQLTGLIGYQYGVFDYNSDEIIAILDTGDVVRGEDRDNSSHYFYVGAERAFSDVLRGQARVGVQYTEYDKFGGSELGPYADISATYEYLRGSQVQLGLRHSRNATDVAAPEGDEVTQDQETTMLTAAVNHRITPRLTANLLGNFGHSVFSGGGVDDDAENWLLAGANLEYQFAPNWFTEAGYNFDRLDSDLELRSYTRNKIYVGVRARY